MLNSAPMVRRAVAGVLGAGAVSGAVLFGVLGAAPASAQPVPQNDPPNCTAASTTVNGSAVTRSPLTSTTSQGSRFLRRRRLLSWQRP